MPARPRCDPAPDIFLSYRRSDRELAGELVAVLERRGPSVWWDADIAGGEDWRDTIVEQLTAARCLVIVFSEACNTSKQLKKELAVADHLDKEVIPVLIEPTEPRGFFLYELASRQWISIHPSPATEAGAGGPARSSSDSGAMGWSAMPAVARSAPPAARCRAPAPPAPSAAERGRLVRASSRSSATGRLSVGDLFPFHWIDLVLPTLVAVMALVSGNGGAVGERVATASFLFVADPRADRADRLPDPLLPASRQPPPRRRRPGRRQRWCSPRWPPIAGLSLGRADSWTRAWRRPTPGTT